MIMIQRCEPNDLKPNEEIYCFGTQNSTYYSKDLEELKKVYKSNKSKTKGKLSLLVNSWNEQYKVWCLTLKKIID